ncbi:hypothetical protein IW248_003295 [Micromonospora ureilytica]|uniref:Uncharacterized protein n=1 Tax=Micromonospora ureilytica TaxID=709868 RepID=A0ABS0JIU9_9ACTN|nr:hypothetical protein [Micromonospora ureilytica]
MERISTHRICAAPARQQSDQLMPVHADDSTQATSSGMRRRCRSRAAGQGATPGRRHGSRGGRVTNRLTTGTDFAGRAWTQEDRSCSSLVVGEQVGRLCWLPGGQGVGGSCDASGAVVRKAAAGWLGRHPSPSALRMTAATSDGRTGIDGPPVQLLGWSWGMLTSSTLPLQSACSTAKASGRSPSAWA